MKAGPNFHYFIAIMTEIKCRKPTVSDFIGVSAYGTLIHIVITTMTSFRSHMFLLFFRLLLSDMVIDIQIPGGWPFNQPFCGSRWWRAFYILNFCWSRLTLVDTKQKTALPIVISAGVDPLLCFMCTMSYSSTSSPFSWVSFMHQNGFVLCVIAILLCGLSHRWWNTN